jgi:hypothetical protein
MKAATMQDADLLSNDEATKAIIEVTESLLHLDHVLDEGRAAADAAVLAATAHAQADVLRNKARRQRERGVEHLARRHDGVASLMVEVEIRERVVGSAFERYFATIESGIHVINKRSALFVGDNNAEKINETIVNMVATMEAAAEHELQQVMVSLAVHSAKDDFLIPTYTNPAARHDVQIRTRLGRRILSVVQKQDELVVKLNQLLWNDEVDLDAIDQVEYNIKKDLRTLAVFIQRTLRGMHSRVSPAAGPAAAGAQGKPATPEAQVA